MRSIFRTTHKYLGLTFGILWLLQALTGVLLVFNGEIDDALLHGPDRPLAPAAFAAAATNIAAAHPNETLTYIMASEGSANRYDLLFTDKDDHTRSVRVDGEGSVVQERPRDYDYPAPGIFQTAHDFHETLFAGDRGKWFLGLSGLLLLSNLLLGLWLAWPGRGQAWRRIVLPGSAGPPVVKYFKWHRALGVCVLLPAIVMAACGVLQEWPPDDLLGVDGTAPTPHQSAQAQFIPLGAALPAALARYPGAALSIVRMPDADRPWYRVRLRQTGELRRVFGQTSVYIDAHDGAVLRDSDAFKLPLNERFVDAIYPIHSGEAFGIGGRLIVLLTGLSLLAMGVLGAGMWWTRRAGRSTSKKNQSPAMVQQ